MGDTQGRMSISSRWLRTLAYKSTLDKDQRKKGMKRPVMRGLPGKA